MRPEMIEFSNGIPVRAYVRSGNSYPFHWHDALEIIQVLKGSINISLGDDDQVLQEGDIAITNMRELHRLKGDGDEEILFIHIDSDFCRSIFSNQYIFIYCCSSYHETQVPEKYRIVKEYIARLIVLLDVDSDYMINGNVVRKLLQEMLNYVAYNFEFIRWGYGTIPFDEKRITRLRKMVMYTTTDAEVKMGLTALANELEISVQHLSGDIKAKFGMTFQELLNYSRCEYAAKLLLGTNRNIVQIAADSGFSDNKYLVKYFKRFFHVTPTNFRKAFQANNTTLTLQTQYKDMPLHHALDRLVI